ncbi:CLUMA_CG013029, isoform A [Clunio marinus]|uniref:CLUMA_CG013029, isoform A n=1 Tax=Clunio marinus TaxID=568069 RepID=A0A1J1IHH6_9DIPT|nr:CLUMA_CG013029, isoform A [Clunio marinus]
MANLLIAITEKEEKERKKNVPRLVSRKQLPDYRVTFVDPDARTNLTYLHTFLLKWIVPVVLMRSRVKVENGKTFSTLMTDCASSDLRESFL